MPEQNSDEELPSKPSEDQGGINIWLYLGILLVILCMASGLLALFNSNASPWLPVNLHSILRADYSPDPFSTPLPGVGLTIIREIIADAYLGGQGGSPEVSSRYATLQTQLETPVPTVTPPRPTQTAPGQTAPTATVRVTMTLPPTQWVTPSVALSLTPTSTGIPSETVTASPTTTLTWTSSPTLVVWTNTPHPTIVVTRRPTATRPSPSRTPRPTSPPPTVGPPTHPPPTHPPPPPPTRTPQPYPYP